MTHDQITTLIDLIHESKAGKEVRAQAIRAIKHLAEENAQLRATLRRISNYGREITYCRDGHEEAVLHARAALEGGTDG